MATTPKPNYESIIVKVAIRRGREKAEAESSPAAAMQFALASIDEAAEECRMVCGEAKVPRFSRMAVRSSIRMMMER